MEIADQFSKLVFGGVVLLCMSTVGCGAPIEDDKDGRQPGDVVVLAFQAAIGGDFDAANGFGTEHFVNDESRHRKSIEEGRTKASVPSSAWPSRVFELKNVDDVSVKSQKWGANEKIVLVRITTPKGDHEVGVLLVDGQWKLAGGKDYKAQ